MYELPLSPKRKATLDELQSFFERYILGRSEDKVEMVGHDDELVQEEAAFATVVREDVKKQARHFLFLEKQIPSVRIGRDEERADFVRSIAHVPPALKRIFYTYPFSRP